MNNGTTKHETAAPDAEPPKPPPAPAERPTEAPQKKKAPKPPPPAPAAAAEERRPRIVLLTPAAHVYQPTRPSIAADIGILDAAYIPLTTQPVYLRTGIALDVPEGWAARIIGRASTLQAHHLLVPESWIGPGLSEQIVIPVVNLGLEPRHFEAGARLAQVFFVAARATEIGIVR